MPIDVYLNVAVGGVLTGLVYGLMALGLSVIFGVIRVVNFAHGEMMTIAMYRMGSVADYRTKGRAGRFRSRSGGDAIAYLGFVVAFRS